MTKTTGDRLKKSLLILSITVLATASGCVSSKGKVSRVSAESSEKVLKYALGEPVSIDPAFAVEGEGLQVVKQVFDGLVDYDPKTLKAVPAVASSWRSNQSGDEWTFRLREGVRFHNGRVISAQDFIYSWNRVAARKTGSEVAYHLAPIRGFDKVQSGKETRLSGLSSPAPNVLKVKLAYPFADFPNILGHPVFSPVPKEEVAKGEGKYGLKPVGNGPFLVKEPWKHQESISLTSFGRYYGAKPRIAGVDFKIVDNDQSAFLQFQGGSLDFTSIPSGQMGEVKKQFGKHALVGQPQLVLNFYGFNLRRAPFKNNVALRQAVSYAVNRPVMANKLYEGAYVAAGSIVPPAGNAQRSLKNSHEFSVKKAKALLKKAGFPGGKGVPKIKLIYGAGRGHEGPAQVFQENLAELGIKVELLALEKGAFIKAMQTGDMTLFAGSWAADYPGPDAFLYPLFHSESGDNMLGYANKKVDKLIMRARRTASPSEREKLYTQAEEIILSDSPVVPLTFVGSANVHGRNLTGFVRTPLDDTPLDRVGFTD